MNKNIKTKTKTTYGVYNLVEWHAILHMGKATIKVPFTGGSITTQGVTPATFTTENPVIQFAIEKSPEFINGKIKIVRRANLKDVIEIECNAPKVATDATDCGPTSISTKSTAAAGEEIEGTPGMQADNKTETDENAAAAPAIMTQVEFSCNDDAKDYLEETFGYVRSKLRNREDIINAGKARNVEIIFV